MVLVVLSGVVGRFIYVQIPRTIQGQELSINELSSMKEDLAKRIRTVLSEDASTLSEFEKEYLLPIVTKLLIYRLLLVLFSGIILI